MTPEQFVYWLQGFVEIREKQEIGLTEREWDIIKDHLKTVFHKATPTYTPPFSVPNGTSNPPYFDPSRIIC
jgi:hypothetical protein